MGAVSTDPPPNLAKGHTCFCTLHPCSNNPSVCVNHPPPSPPVWDGTNRKSGSQKEAHSSTQKTTCKQRRPPNDVVGELQWVCLCLLEHKHAAPSCLMYYIYVKKSMSCWKNQTDEHNIEEFGVIMKLESWSIIVHEFEREGGVDALLAF